MSLTQGGLLLLAVMIAWLLLPNVNRVGCDRLISHWSRRLLKILGIRVKVDAPPRYKAVRCWSPIVAAALRYRAQGGEFSAVPAYIDDMSIWQSFKRIISEPGLVAELTFDKPLAPEHHRRELARHAETAVAELLGVSSKIMKV